MLLVETVLTFCFSWCSVPLKLSLFLTGLQVVGVLSTSSGKTNIHIDFNMRVRFEVLMLLTFLGDLLEKEPVGSSPSSPDDVQNQSIYVYNQIVLI